MILKATDFKGYHKISQNSHNEGELNDYIATYEREYIDSLLGYDLAELFYADLDSNGQPQSQRFIDIFNPFVLDNDGCGDIVRSRGVKYMLLGFLYYQYAKDTNFFSTIAGFVKNRFSNSKEVRDVEVGINERYNVSVLTYDAIQRKINGNLTTYPEYKGVTKELIIWL